MIEEITCREATATDSGKLSLLFKTVYIETYGTEGVSDEFANFTAKQFSTERLETLVTERPGSLIVAEYKGNLVGAAETCPEKKCPVGNITGPELSKLYVLARFCGRGAGQALLHHAENALRKANHPLIWLWTLETNARAIRFYEKHAYRDIGSAAFQMERNSYINRVMVKHLG